MEPQVGDGRVRARRALRIAELLLAGGGIVCLLAYGAACAQGAWFQSQESAAFDEALRARLHAEAPDRSHWSAGRIERYEASLKRPVQALGRLEIPDAEISVMVLDGTDEQTLDRAVGRIEGTARPGEDGNVGIAGHRDGYFRGLRLLEVGDAIRLSTLEGVGHYEIVEARVVAPEQVDVLAPTEEPTLTLVTCFPFYHVGSAPERYVVRAVRRGFEHWRSADLLGRAEREASPES